MNNRQCAQELQSSTQASHESQGEQKINQSVSVSVSSNDSRKVSRQDIELVQNLIEICLQLYMNRDEVVKTLLALARINPGFTSLETGRRKRRLLPGLLHKVETKEANNNVQSFARAPVPSHEVSSCTSKDSSRTDASHGTCTVVNMPMGYPMLHQHPHMHFLPGHPHFDAMGMSSCHVVNGVPANFQPLKMNSTNDMVIDTTPQVIPPRSGEMAVSPASVASSGHFPFDASDTVMDPSVLDSAFTSEVGGDGNARDSLRSFDQIPWNFSLSDFTADLSNLGELGGSGNYDSEILLDSPDHEDIDEFFVDVPGPPCSNSDEEKL